MGRALLALLLAVAIGGVAVAQASMDEADAAFDAGDHARARALYDEVLASEPGNPRALMRSALLWSWAGAYDEAIRRYDRLLAADPGNRAAAFERAKVLSWNRRFAEAAAALRELLAASPSDLEMRLALARALSWGGRQGAARDEYARVLEIEPENRAALVGIAQTHAWSGRLGEGRRWYERALASAPGDHDAALGLAYVHLWSGRAALAHEMARDLAARFPDDAEVRTLGERTGEAAGPWAALSAERGADTDENELDVARLEGGFAVGPRADLTVSVARHDMQDPVGHARNDSAWLGASFRPAADHGITARIGVDRARDTAGRTDSEAIGGAAWIFGLERPWQVSVSATRDALRYSPVITDNGILVDELRADYSGRPAPRWRAFGGAGLGDFSDGNARRRLDAGFARRLPAPRPRLEVGYAFAYLDFDDDLPNGYFDPQDFTSHLAQLRGDGEFGAAGRYRYSFGLDAGVQSFTLAGVGTRNDAVWLATGRLRIPLGSRLGLELYAGRGDYAAQTAAGFESWQVGTRLRWSGGAP